MHILLPLDSFLSPKFESNHCIAWDTKEKNLRGIGYSFSNFGSIQKSMALNNPLLRSGSNSVVMIQNSSWVWASEQMQWNAMVHVSELMQWKWKCVVVSLGALHTSLKTWSLSSVLNCSPMWLICIFSFTCNSHTVCSDTQSDFNRRRRWTRNEQ